MDRVLIPAAFYLGVGALCHVIFIGQTFDWSSAWTYAWLLAWPIILGSGGVVVLLAALAAVILWDL